MMQLIMPYLIAAGIGSAGTYAFLRGVSGWVTAFEAEIQAKFAALEAQVTHSAAPAKPQTPAPPPPTVHAQ